MNSFRFPYGEISLWLLTLYVALHVPSVETRVDELEQHGAHAQLQHNEEPSPSSSTERPEPRLDRRQCFHMDRSECPTGHTRCKRVATAAVFCCDVNDFTLKEGLAMTYQNTSYLHVLAPNIEELDVSHFFFRRLSSMAFTDGYIGNITGQFPKHSSIACLNISNNNLTSEKLNSQRPFAYLFNLTVLDASKNNLTEFPLSLVHSNRMISVDFSDNDYLNCKHFQKAMESNNSSLISFLNYNKTYCALELTYHWFKDVQVVQIDHLRVQRELNASCLKIKPTWAKCTCSLERLELLGGVTNVVAVDCSERGLQDMPGDLPPNTVKVNVSYNHITSLQAIREDHTYEHLKRLIADHNDISSIVDLEGTKFIDNFMLFSISHNKLRTIQPYVLSNKFDTTFGAASTFIIAGNYIHCDCNAEKVLKPWLMENYKNIPDYKSLECENNMGPVVELVETAVCHMPRDWTDYIYYIIGLEVLVLVLLISKVSYDYWVFKTAGYLPWPANKMPRLPCDWLCE